ncbi:lycopene beta-cyclase [Sphingobium sp. OAS761]|uniref:lycopene beta-cyclase CrtY n=1 Tax=Sphingobium sp. OAS761 TaxID=2817901 RepID=UPI0020A0F78F|nr:lycopene beta-cyclase CrtY [Sphingobium sp. OAS761]MCP1469044.1 lycopene beta-cyclase [Sphingobium sp. OAS761]
MNGEMECDLAIVGGGLAGGLLAHAFAVLRPEVRLMLIESGPQAGGNHLWSFFDGDVADSDRWLVDPFITHRWPQGHDVRFPGFERTLDCGYQSIESGRFHATLAALLGPRLLTGASAAVIAPDQVTLADGRVIRAGAVIDARGAVDLSALRCGWQKFVGHSLHLDAPHGVDRPVIMDATVDQVDGYRFVYLLPRDDRTIFIEDTYYSDTPDLDVPAIAARIAAYAAARGWDGTIVHREQGVLPVVHGGAFDRFWPADDPIARAGVRAGLFQPMTGYSLPDAVRFALWLAGRPLDDLPAATRAHARTCWRHGGYYRLLGRMLFGAARPPLRWRIFARFYRLPAPLIQRFYSGRSTIVDRIRILCGRPPVPIRSAMRALLDPSFR